MSFLPRNSGCPPSSMQAIVKAHRVRVEVKRACQLSFENYYSVLAMYKKAVPVTYAEGQVVHEGVALAVDHFHGSVGFLLEALVLSFGDHAFDGLFTGGADAGNNHIFRVVQVLVGSDFAFVLLAEQNGLPRDDVRPGEVDLQVDPALAGKVIYATGRAETQDVLTDPIFGASATAINISRKVEYYQWEEHSRQEKRKKLGGGEETVTTYTYTQEWVGEPIDSGEFRDPEYQGRNKVLAKYEDETLYASNVSFGAYTLPDFLKRSIGGAVPLDLVLDEEKKKAIFKGLSVETGLAGNPL